MANTAFDMDEQNQAGPPPQYVWPKFVLAGVVLGIVLAVFWMAVLVHRIREQREDMAWPTNTAKPISSESGGASAIERTNSMPAPSTNSSTATNLPVQ